MTWENVLLWIEAQLLPWISEERQWIMLWMALLLFAVLRWVNRRWPEER